MTPEGCVALTVETAAGRADLLVDGHRPLQDVLAALVAATGAAGDEDGTERVRWQVSEGQRRLTPMSATLAELRVLDGAVLRLTPG